MTQKKHNFILFCKSFRGDFERMKVLKKSVDKYNADKIPFYVICPRNDLELFEKNLRTNKETYHFELISDEDVLGFNKNQNHEQNWRNQQIVKLVFYKMQIAEHYFILDSDCYFIKDFRTDDFMYDKKTPYMPITEVAKSDFTMAPLMQYLKGEGIPKANYVSKDFLERKGKPFCLSLPCIFSSKVLEHMEKNLLKKKSLTFNDLIKINPFEFEWYLDYLLKNKVIDFVTCMPFFASIAHHTSYQIYRYLGFNEDVFKLVYSGIIMHEGYVKDIKFKPSIIGKFFSKIILINYSWHKYKINKDQKKIPFLQKIEKFFIKKYIVIPFRVFLNIKKKKRPHA